ncbi:hypothetical protein R2325_16455 [Mycobacteroides chelonae]|uniref:hypothetical protein n=1 Tax=Mycobacteroides TaxID=670516 RepID=UPI00092970F5|nr:MULTISPECIES: hypothetical protein [Mycobacteroides]MBV6360445.1 hypothetical protein [Mycobacteroides chelonae]MEC4857167.1 hypothetical protein [Mycobacteroides chelonae]MEC4873576.1 hypothetical protein [Mycobacteroides chelonae]SHW93791.1 gp28 protein [Mycobacteroides abscessus subsp. abscessus]SKL80593.1 gp28 protein [Mycobacteroides abscessus subsp. abscessus]
MTMPSGSDPDGFDAEALEGTIVGPGLSSLAGRERGPVEEMLKQRVQDNTSLKNASDSVFDGLNPALGLPLAILAALVSKLMPGLVPDMSGGMPNFLESLKEIPILGDLLNMLIKMFDKNSTATGQGGLQGVIGNLMKLIGQPPNLSGTGTGGFDLFGALQKLLKQLQGAGAITTDNPAPPSQYAALATVAGPNKLRDRTFAGPQLVQGQSNWMWDSPAVPHRNSVRTVRNGLITVYWVGGTYTDLFGNEPPLIPFEQWMWQALPMEIVNSRGGIFPPQCSIDPLHFEVINVPYPGKAFPMNDSIQAGVDYLCELIDKIPGKFILAGLSQGSSVISNVYDELRTGRLQHRRADFIHGHADCNPRHQAGHSFTDEVYGHWPDPVPTKSGMQLPNLEDCEDIWWETYRADDIVSCCENDPSGPNYGRDQFIRTEFNIVNQDWNGIAKIILAGPLGWLQAFDAFMAIYNDVFVPYEPDGDLTPHHRFWGGDVPFESLGDTRFPAQIMADKINDFADLVTPPLVGELHQLEGERFAAAPRQIVVAGCDTFWINVDVPSDYVAIMVGVNAYDADDNLIGMVTGDDDAVIVGPGGYQLDPIHIEGAFVMPEGTVSACMVFDVEPAVMTTGTVWFMNPKFETGALVDAALLDNIANMPQVPLENIGGPMGQANMLTAFHDLVDGQASALHQQGLSGQQLADLFAAQGQKAVDTAAALAMAIEHQRILTNTTTAPVYTGLQRTGEVTFPLTSFPQGTVLPYTTVSSGTAIAGAITCQQAVTKGFLEFMAQGTGTGVYVNVYSVNPDTGLWTKKWGSADISSQVPDSSWAYVSVTIPSGARIPVGVGDRMFVEIVTTGGDLKVATITMPTPNNPGTYPPNFGASRTLSTTGGTSPSTIAQTSITFSGTVPWVCFGIENVPAVYQPPDRAEFTTPGVYSYSIPLWVKAGNLLDCAALGGGGTGGGANGFFTVNTGQGGTGGEWDTHTWNYGTDIPDTVTSLKAIVGGGNTVTSGDGFPTIIGYGNVSTPAFDAVGVGGYASGATTLSWNHTATAGAYTVVYINSSYGTFDVKYNGVLMKPLGVAYLNNNGGLGVVAAYGIPNVPGGERTITVTTAASANFSGNSVSYTGVSGAARVAGSFGFGNALSQVLDIQANQIVVHGYGTWNSQLSSFSGGTQRTYRHGNYLYSLSISDSSVDTTFAANVASSGSDHWSGLAVVLNPTVEHVLLTADGGHAGGPGGTANYNPSNSNTTSNGMSPGGVNLGGRWYSGGMQVGPGAAGSPPGGGGGGGTAQVLPQPAGNGGAWFTARQS